MVYVRSTHIASIEGSTTKPLGGRTNSFELAKQDFATPANLITTASWPIRQGALQRVPP